MYVAASALAVEDIRDFDEQQPHLHRLLLLVFRVCAGRPTMRWISVQPVAFRCSRNLLLSRLEEYSCAGSDCFRLQLFRQCQAATRHMSLSHHSDTPYEFVWKLWQSAKLIVLNFRHGGEGTVNVEGPNVRPFRVLHHRQVPSFNVSMCVPLLLVNDNASYMRPFLDMHCADHRKVCLQCMRSGKQMTNTAR